MRGKIKNTIITIIFSIMCICLIVIPSEAKDLGNANEATVAVRRTNDYDLHLSGTANGASDDTFCVQEGAHVNTGNKYYVKNRIEIDGLDSTVYEGNTNKVIDKKTDKIENGAMAWILAQKDTGSNHVAAEGKTYSPKQKAVYGFFGTWKRANELTDYKTRSMGYTNAKWIRQGITYAKNYKKDEKASIKDTTDMKKVKMEVYGEYIKVGPFKWNYTGKLEEVKVYNQDDNEVSAKIAKYSGKELKILDNNTKITSGKDFYVLVKADDKTSSIQVKGKVALTKEKYTATIWTLSHKYQVNGKWYEGQNIITTIANSKPSKSSDDVKTDKVDLLINLSGYVWTDEIYGKDSKRNDLYKSEEADKFDKGINGIKVYLKDKNGKVIAETETKELGIYNEIKDGEYRFKNVEIAKLDEYYVEFNYNGLTYTNVVAHTDKNNGSKATEIPNVRENLNNVFKTGITGQTDVSKINTTMQSITKQTPYSLNSAYKKQGGTEIKYVNLGLIPREQPDFGLAKDLDSVNISVNGYHHIYKYGKKNMEQSETVTENGFNVGVKFGIDHTGLYRRAVYKADADYVTEDKSKELQMDLTYKIALRNESTTLKAQINSIVEYYDSRYESITAGTGLDEKGQITGTFNAPTPETYNEKYKKAIINTNGIQVEGAHVKYIYVQFKLGREAVQALISDTSESEDVLLRNVAEINSYTPLDSNGKPYAGIDKDSTPGNATLGDVSTYEDDADSAPTLKLEKANNRKMSGKVFLDSTTGELRTGEIRQGSGAYEEGERGISGVEIILTENKENGQKYGPVTTNEDGDFEISNFIPGDYTLTYTWGDDTYTVQNYKGTVYDASRNQSDKNWYKYNVDTRKTDAIDNYQTRQNIDNEMKTITNSTQATITKMDSNTPTMGISIENLVETTSEGDRFEYEVKNVDFGIVERARQDLGLTKRVKTMKVTLANGQVISDFEIGEDGRLQGQKDHITYMKPSNNTEPANGFVKLELDNELIQGAIVEVGYEIKATNNSELDYVSENGAFYKYGTIEGNLVTITPSAIIDYLDNDWAFDSEKNSQWQVKTLDDITDIVAETVYNDENTTINNKTILYTECLNEKKIEPTKSEVVMLNVSKTLSTTDEINLDNETEIAKVEKNGGSKLISTPGSYVPGSSNHESDDSTAETVIVTPSTGNNLAFILPITVGVVALAILGTGIVIIKKKVLSK